MRLTQTHLKDVQPVPMYQLKIRNEKDLFLKWSQLLIFLWEQNCVIAPEPDQTTKNYLYFKTALY